MIILFSMSFNLTTWYTSSLCCSSCVTSTSSTCWLVSSGFVLDGSLVLQTRSLESVSLTSSCGLLILCFSTQIQNKNSNSKQFSNTIFWIFPNTILLIWIQTKQEELSVIFMIKTSHLIIIVNIWQINLIAIFITRKVAEITKGVIRAREGEHQEVIILRKRNLRDFFNHSLHWHHQTALTNILLISSEFNYILSLRSSCRSKPHPYKSYPHHSCTASWWSQWVHSKSSTCRCPCSSKYDPRE